MNITSWIRRALNADGQRERRDERERRMREVERKEAERERIVEMEDYESWYGLDSHDRESR